MPFDRISPRQLFWMRVVTGLMIGGLGLVLGLSAGGALIGVVDDTTRFAEPVGSLFLFASLVFAVHLVNAGMMLLELVTVPPVKIGINVPFVAGNYQTSLVYGLVALVFAGRHMMLAGDASSLVVVVPGLVVLGFVLNLVFVLLTKLHWNFTANTGRALPKG